MAVAHRTNTYFTALYAAVSSASPTLPRGLPFGSSLCAFMYAAIAVNTMDTSCISGYNPVQAYSCISAAIAGDSGKVYSC